MRWKASFLQPWSGDVIIPLIKKLTQEVRSSKLTIKNLQSQILLDTEYPRLTEDATKPLGYSGVEFENKTGSYECHSMLS